MLIIKPYGRSFVEESGSARKIRKAEQSVEDIHTHVREEDALVIAQWVSVIDKILRKPKKDDAPTETLVQWRNNLGKACWEIICDKGLLKSKDDTKTKKIWDWKIAPFGTGGNDEDEKPTLGKNGAFHYLKDKYDLSKNEDCEDLAELIYEHLYESAYSGRPAESGGEKPKGAISHRADSIKKNFINPDREAKPSFMTADLDVYFDPQGADVAAMIYKEIKEATQNKQEGKRGVNRGLYGKAVAEIKKHYAVLFRDTQGNVLSICEAKEQKSGLFAVHEAVKDHYKRTLKTSKKRDVLSILPKNAGELKRALGYRQQNQDINHLIQYGKILHYSLPSIDGGLDATKFANNLDNLTIEPHYMTDVGQSKIKRNEALVRIWRTSLSFAARSLKQWADPEDHIKQDILGGEPLRTEICNAYRNSGKADLLFMQKNFDNAETLRFALEGIADLRNSSFHFKGLGEFIKNIEKLKSPPENVETLWKKSKKEQRNQIIATLRAINCEDLLLQEEVEKVYAEVQNQGATFPLPKFKKLLTRAKNVDATQKKNSSRLDLAEPISHGERDEAKVCQYTVLKMLYETGFKAELTNFSKSEIDSWIGESIKRTSKQAQDINGREGDPDIRSKAEKLREKGFFDGEGNYFESFLFALSRESNSEMRVQNFYESDAEEARESASYIEDLKCDVVARAFKHYLSKIFPFLLPPLRRGTKPCDLELLKKDEDFTPEAKWIPALFFLFHLMPVEPVNALHQQILKWNVLSEKGNDNRPTIKEQVESLLAVLKLYIELHDARIKGGETKLEQKDLDQISCFYETPDLAKTIFQQDGGDALIPIRGLREMVRFGHAEQIRDIYDAPSLKVTRQDWDQCQDLNRWIEKAQSVRTDLHSKWVGKEPFSKDEYEKVLALIREHRELSHRLFLVDHLRLYKLMMTVLGRLVDYSGLWERNLYFVLLALIKRKKLKLMDVFRDKECRKFKDTESRIKKGEEVSRDELPALLSGEIVKAVGTLKEDSGIKDEIETLFKLSSVRGYRNDFAHFNMLKQACALNLTCEVNKARELMAHDRKLKNAVAKSIKELLEREGIHIEWEMANHKLTAPKISAKTILHLNNNTLKEELHSRHYVEAVSRLFAGTVKKPVESPANEAYNPRNGHRGHRKKTASNRGNRENNPPFSRGKSGKRPDRSSH